VKVVVTGWFVVGFIVRDELRLAPTTGHFQHHLDGFQALETAKITIKARYRFGQVHVVYLKDRLLRQWHDEWLHERLWKMPF
jgi:hypothetical protein